MAGTLLMRHGADDPGFSPLLFLPGSTGLFIDQIG